MTDAKILAYINLHAILGSIPYLCEIDERAKELIKNETVSLGFRVKGGPSLFYLRIADDPTLILHQEWIAECVKRGVFFTNHHNHFINAALTDADIAETIDIAEEAFAVVRKRH